MHEASLWPENCFITLTYDQEHLPQYGTLRLDHFQDFMKRLRARHEGKTIRFFHCGEYGAGNEIERIGRPHYHAILFNHDFEDKAYFREDNGSVLYTSRALSEIWQEKGFVTVGDVTFESAAYVARYVLKKVTGDDSFHHYMKLGEDFELYEVDPEYTTMSRRPGIGDGWYKQFKDDLWPQDHVVLDGREMSVPRYYREKLISENPELAEDLRRKRLARQLERKGDLTPERLVAREKVKHAQLGQLHRGLEKELT